jgi:hypothetical protein
MVESMSWINYLFVVQTLVYDSITYLRLNPLSLVQYVVFVRLNLLCMLNPLSMVESLSWFNAFFMAQSHVRSIPFLCFNPCLRFYP